MGILLTKKPQKITYKKAKQFYFTRKVNSDGNKIQMIMIQYNAKTAIRSHQVTKHPLLNEYSVCAVIT